MAKAAFLTYNTVGEPGAFRSGVTAINGHEAIVVQHPKGQRWGAQVDGVDPVWTPEATAQLQAEPEVVKPQCYAAGRARESLVSDLYSGIFDPKSLAELDYVVVYVGALGSEGAIALAAQAPRDKVRFVLCDCALDEKFNQVHKHGMERVPYLMCECGGRATMGKLVRQFLQTGSVGPQ